MSEKTPTDNHTAQKRVCPACGVANDPNALMCANCGIQLLAASLTELSASFTTTLQQLVQYCPVCGHVNRPGELRCENCGAILADDSAVASGAATTENLGGPSHGDEPIVDVTPKKSITARLIDPSAPPPMPSVDPSYFANDMVLRLEISDAPRAILLYPAMETVVGRRDPVSGQTPDVDLGVYAGYRRGISRRHAILHLRNHALNLIDLGSSNGTAINGRPLTPMEPYLLRSGDQILFGKMLVKITFVRSSKPRQ